ncbi:MAG: hypothetical protein IT233_02640 [Bacteroidia bacterium]|nr:hypothetical protein [Bacteroidia bacterium]
MKRALAIIWLLVLLTGLFGVMPYFFFKQSQIRSAVKHKLKSHVPETELHALRFNTNAHILWVREGKEFKLNGLFYDVVKTETDGKTIIYYCVNDTEEKILFEKLELLCQQQARQNGDPAGAAVQQFVKLFSIDLPSINSSCLLPASSCLLTAFCTLPTRAPFLVPPTPPPDLKG